MIIELFFLLLGSTILILITLGGEAKEKALSKEAATSRKSIQKIISDYNLARLGVKGNADD